MLPVGLLLAAAGVATVLIGLFSDNGRFIGWHIGTHSALVIGIVSAAAFMIGLRLVRHGAVRGVKNAVAQRRFEKRAREARED